MNVQNSTSATNICDCNQAGGNDNVNAPGGTDNGNADGGNAASGAESQKWQHCHKNGRLRLHWEKMYIEWLLNS